MTVLTRVAESFAALVACVRLLSRVQAFVLFQVMLMLKPFGAHRALIASLLVVDLALSLRLSARSALEKSLHRVRHRRRLVRLHEQHEFVVEHVRQLAVLIRRAT